jgi:hypothetical protein
VCLRFPFAAIVVITRVVIAFVSLCLIQLEVSAAGLGRASPKGLLTDGSMTLALSTPVLRTNLEGHVYCHIPVVLENRSAELRSVIQGGIYVNNYRLESRKDENSPWILETRIPPCPVGAIHISDVVPGTNWTSSIVLDSRYSGFQIRVSFTVYRRIDQTDRRWFEKLPDLGECRSDVITVPAFNRANQSVEATQPRPEVLHDQ